nr:uncharacterized protein LOC132426955 [Delphinus delphis]XP_059869831.1 uncharacterized protein LOC132426955 [Delphinus delphis]XP_059869832.1 uncharacterized protein LOC132426955 [Delphinus delphis]XP_059869833.1 uncharacterized protein LOC132426955 [Delphinus delphis]XP_059869834.1 uncharacterized protein LOC132426955 [Delphinus delphis]XP_059869835.1 uncharacterized protein LOC132426955 [Delphinus delphis]
MTHSLPLRASGSRKKMEAGRGKATTRLAVLGGGPEQAVLLSSRNPGGHLGGGGWGLWPMCCRHYGDRDFHSPHPASLEEGWLHQHKASRGSAGVQGREDSSLVTQQMASLALQPEAGVPSLDGVKDRSERARKEHDHVLLRPVDTRCPGEGHSSHCSPRTAAEAAQTSLALCSKTGSCCKIVPSKRAAQSPWTLDEGWWLEAWACLWVSVVGFVIDWVLLGSGRGPRSRGGQAPARGPGPGSCCQAAAPSGLVSLRGASFPIWEAGTGTPGLSVSGNFCKFLCMLLPGLRHLLLAQTGPLHSPGQPSTPTCWPGSQGRGRRLQAAL